MVAIATICARARPALAQGAPPGHARDADAREQRFLYLLRTYPERRPDDTLAQVAALVDQGPFPDRDRALFWSGSARLSLHDLAGARAWFARLSREHPDSIWVQRSYLGLAEAAAAERDFAQALSWYARADGSSVPAVREMARTARPQILILQRRQRLAWLCAALLCAGCLALLVFALRSRPQSEGSFSARARAALAPPGEARILLPLLVVIALASLRQERAARDAALELCASGAVLAWLSGACLRTRPLRLPLRALYAAGMLALLGCGAYLAIWRHDLVGMVEETWRAGPD